jgi:hypothetical protein
MKKSGNKNKARKSRPSGGNKSPSHPPQLDGSELRHSMSVRFITNAAINQAITFQNLLDTYFVAATAVAGFDVFQTVKVRRVQVWALPSLGSASAVLVEFAGVTAGIVGDQSIHSDTSMGIQPAHVDCRPSRKSLASDYQLSSNATAFNLVCPSGSVVDVSLSFTGQFNAAVALQNAVAGATAGAFYLRGLDGLAVATTKLIPELAFATL